MSGPAVFGQIVQALAAVPPDVLSAIGRVVSRILAGDTSGAAAEAEKAATIQAGKAAFGAAAKAGRAARK